MRTVLLQVKTNFYLLMQIQYKINFRFISILQLVETEFLKWGLQIFIGIYLGRLCSFFGRFEPRVKYGYQY
jgi:hypothetical protein